MLQENGFSEILGCDTVRALSADPDGEDGDIVLTVDDTIPVAGAGPREDRQVYVKRGEVGLATLLGDLQKVFATTGNVHWGDSTDARLLCDALNIGLFMFADQLQAGGARCLCALDLLRGDFPYFINLSWDEPVHFRAAEFREAQGDAFHICYATADIPDFPRDQYNAAHSRAPIGGEVVPM